MSNDASVQLIKDYQTFQRSPAGKDCPTMQQGGLDVRSHDFQHAREVTQAVREMAPGQGWLQCQSMQTSFTAGLPQFEESWGALLQAEACIDETRALSVRRHADGHWILSEYTHQTKGELLWDEVKHLARGTQAEKLIYRRYWRVEHKQGAIQIAASFLGIDCLQHG